ncbi:MAG TPA: nucleotidyltransferase domain-containing protein [Candidatus Deferrimicrobium sp.]|nr:nucleotidyltransferase domain-containing protein [Candidatus Deferrimicrobium sp.]
MNEDSIKKSIAELKEVLCLTFDEAIELYLFGSVARHDYGPESDIDILVLFPGEVDTRLKIQIIDLAFDIGLKNDIVFNVIVRSKETWKSEMAKVTPFHRNLEREALRL